MKFLKIFLAIMFGLLSSKLYAISFTDSIDNLILKIEVISVPEETAKVSSFSYIVGPNYIIERNSDTITIPEKVSYNSKSFTVVSISDNAFSNLDFKKIILPNTVKSIGKQAFYKSNITSIVLPESLVSIGSNAFSESKISDITLPPSLTTIGSEAFSSCAYLSSLIIPKSVISIGANPFLKTPLKKLEVEDGNSVFAFCDGVLYSRNAIWQYIPTANPSKELTLLEGLTSIGKEAFANQGIKSVKFPSTLRTIGDKAFFGSRLTRIEIPENIESIGENAFTNCTSVKELIIKDGNKQLNVKQSSFYLDYLYYEEVRYGKYVQHYFPDSLNKVFIGRQLCKEACVASNKLQSITFGDNVTSIYYNLLNRPCAGEAEMMWGDIIYYYCFDVKEVLIGKNVNYIEKDAFNQLGKFGEKSSLKSYVISPENMHFRSINGTIYSKDSTELIRAPYNIETVTVFDKTSKIVPGAFYACKIGRVFLPDNITEIPDSMFYQTESIDTLVIPEGVTDINKKAFYRTDISKLVLPSSLKRIQSGSWIDVHEELYCNAQIPPICDDNPFGANVYRDTPLYVPVGTKKLYSKAAHWCNFFNIIESETGGVDDIVADISDEINYSEPYEIYNFNGMKLGDNKESLAPGLYIIRQGSTTKKIAIK